MLCSRKACRSGARCPEYVDASMARADEFMMSFHRATTAWAWGWAWGASNTSDVIGIARPIDRQPRPHHRSREVPRPHYGPRPRLDLLRPPNRRALVAGASELRASSP